VVTGIEWTDATWNPTTGCDRVSPGCDNCYALTMARRLKGMGSPKYQRDGDPRTSGPGFGVAVHDAAMLEPLRWRTPRKVFVNSMSDVGHARVPRIVLARIWAVMALSGRHQFQVLSKRPQRLAAALGSPVFRQAVSREVTELICSRFWQRWQLDLGGLRLAGDSGLGNGWTVTPRPSGNLWSPPWPLPHVWVGTSIETDDYVGRADELRSSPAAVRFLSLEPLLGPLPSLDLTQIDWVIIGGESGPGARPMDLVWAQRLVDQCRAAGVAVFVKQLGSHYGRDHHNIGAFPAGLRVRDYPATTR
jgi:protein gp37